MHPQKESWNVNYRATKKGKLIECFKPVNWKGILWHTDMYLFDKLSAR